MSRSQKWAFLINNISPLTGLLTLEFEWQVGKRVISRPVKDFGIFEFLYVLSKLSRGESRTTKVWLELEILLTRQTFWMMYEPIFLTWLVYWKDIEIAYISRNDDVILENDCVTPEEWLRNTRKWLCRRKDNAVEFQSVLVSKKEGSRYHAKSTPWWNGSKLATDCAPSSEGVVRQQCGGGI